MFIPHSHKGLREQRSSNCAIRFSSWNGCQDGETDTAWSMSEIHSRQIPVVFVCRVRRDELISESECITRCSNAGWMSLKTSTTEFRVNRFPTQSISTENHWNLPTEILSFDSIWRTNDFISTFARKMFQHVGNVQKHFSQCGQIADGCQSDCPLFYSFCLHVWIAQQGANILLQLIYLYSFRYGRCRPFGTRDDIVQ